MYQSSHRNANVLVCAYAWVSARMRVFANSNGCVCWNVCANISCVCWVCVTACLHALDERLTCGRASANGSIYPDTILRCLNYMKTLKQNTCTLQGLKCSRCTSFEKEVFTFTSSLVRAHPSHIMTSASSWVT